MKCRHVIHFNAWRQKNDITSAVKVCLKEADRLQLRSVAFPALRNGLCILPYYQIKQPV